jgi:hypothetical protein
MTDERSDTPDGPPARAQRELDRLALRPWQGGPPSPPFVSNIPSRAGARLPDEDAMADGWNLSSHN